MLSPHDFHRLSALDEDLDELAADRIEPSELALRAHDLEDRPGTAVAGAGSESIVVPDADKVIDAACSAELPRRPRSGAAAVS